MYLFSPVAWPIAKLLDLLLGKNEANTYKKAELKSFLQFHRTGEEPLRDDEITILNGVLELNSKDVQEIMTPLKDTVILSADTILDHKAVDKMCVIFAPPSEIRADENAGILQPFERILAVPCP